MGDYGFGVLVKNGGGNKSAFPVRIPPHLQPQHLQDSSNPPSPPSFVNNACSTNGGSAWLFPSVAQHGNMQDEILESDKSKALDLQDMQEKSQVQSQPQTLSPGQQEVGGGLTELDGVHPDDGSLEKGSLESSVGKEKLRIESPGLSSFDYQDNLGMATSCAQSTPSPSSLTSFNNWSPAVPSNQSPVVGEDVGAFFSPAGSNANGPPLLFQNFSHHAGPGFGVGGSFSPQIGPVTQHHPPTPHPHGQGVPQQHRRSPASPHQHQPSFPPHPHRAGPFAQLPHLAPAQSKPPSPWGSYQSLSTPTSTSWSPGGYSGWGGTQGVREYRRGIGGGVASLNSYSPLKKSFPNNQIPSQKFPRNTSGINHKGWVEDSMNRNDSVYSFQERTRSFDGFNMHSLENSLIDIMRAEQDSLKGRYTFPHQGGDVPLPLNDVQKLITRCFSCYKRTAGPFAASRCSSTIEFACKLAASADRSVQIRPWNLNDSDFVMDGSQPLDPRKTIFVGGVPRPLRAVELAMIMDRLYGGVCYAGIDTDPELKYPKGAGRVAFSNQQSYIAAISARFVQLQHGEIDKRVEVKPYVLDDQLCDECQGTRCGGKFAPFFCANVTCLQYYCEYCWAAIHSRAGREFHKPLVKEGGDRPRHISFRWN
ncbi:PREDICTED: cytoplasmic polyadenylation element-binding protein 4-like [Cyprinodon variegatus]|uniref:cytoplasmic polyadenylation element-binding protein 4-like n=1 Tax=Cyprinodon variegatus TaxID=28743 RepID=UPI000742B906|nr:PREDICTED: cytoplasmic polyadenylation element-binding protein 4-like [Cyprinodon variegatus]